MPDVDQAVRAERLREFADGLYKVNEECFDVNSVELDPEDDDIIVSVPLRFACAQYDGRGTWIGFADTLDDARQVQEDAVAEEYPWAPGEILDLDTGDVYAVKMIAQLQIVRTDEVPS